MRNFTRFPAVFLTLLFVGTACAPVPTSLASTPEAEPTVVPTVIVPTATTAPVNYESSVPAVLWGEQNREHKLFPLDPTSGEALPGYEPISLRRIYFYAFSPDRHTLAVVTFRSESNIDGSLLLVDLLRWKSQQFDLELDGWVAAMTFSPDGAQLAISHGGERANRLTIFDLKRRSILIQGETDLLYPRIKFTLEGDALMLYGLSITEHLKQNTMGGGTPQVILLDTADLSPRWTATLQGVREGIFPKDEATTLTAQMMEEGQAAYLGPGVAFAPDRDALYIVHADSGTLTTADFEAKTVQTVEIHDRLSWFERLLSLTARVAHAKVADGTSKDLAVSPDGQLLYIVGTDTSSVPDQQGTLQISRTPLGLEIIRASDGSRVEHIETNAGELANSPDGLFLYLRAWGNDLYGRPESEVFDTSSRAIVASKAGFYPTPTFRINGEPLLVSTYSLTKNLHHMTVLNPADLSVLADWEGHDYISWLTIE